MAINRLEANRLILEEISSQIESYPDLRFQQILQNISITELDKKVQIGKFQNEVEYYSTDKFHEESVTTLKRIKGK